MSLRDRSSTAGPTEGAQDAQDAQDPAGTVVPHPSATSARLEWTYPDGSHKATVDNAPEAAGPGEESWVSVEDRQSDRRWAGVAFILYGEPMTEVPGEWHRHEDTNGANNGDVVQDGRPGRFPAVDVYAARICEGVRSELDPESCSEWRYFDRG